MQMSQYLQLFLSESREHLLHMGELVVGLEQSPEDHDNINSLFRSAHSLKGMAASMGFASIADLAHRMEDLMHKVREGEFRFTKEIASLLLEGSDLLSSMLEDLESGRSTSQDTGDLIRRLQGYSPETPHTASPSIKPHEKSAPASATATPPPPRESPHTVKIRTDILDRLINTTGELFSTKHRLLAANRDCPTGRLAEPLADMTRLLRELHQIAMQVRLTPFATIAERFPRAVRDIATRSGKEVTLTIEGKDIEIDRGMLEELSDPLLHILRNAVDHGIEPPDRRLSAGKHPSGSIRLSAWREKDQVAIAVQDDGQGMDPIRLVETAVARGIISLEEGQSLSPHEVFLLTCLPGFSTAPEVTDISGRGVGMDAVRTTIQAIGGRLAIESEPGKGCRIILRLPLTIAVINVLLLSLQHFTVGIPVTVVVKTLELRREMVRPSGNHPVFDLDGEEIPLVSLNRVMGLPLQATPVDLLPVIVTEAKGQLVGIAVDRVLGQQEVHVKQLGRPLNRLRGLSGGAILANGKVIFIIDPASML